MPVLDGIATLKRMRSSGRPWAGLPVIALTADAMSGDRERYLAEGMNGYLSKPIDQRELLAEITRLLGRAAGTELSEALPVRPATVQNSAHAPAEPSEAATSDADLSALLAAMDGEVSPRKAEPLPMGASAPVAYQPEMHTAPSTSVANEYDMATLAQEAIDCLPDGFAILDSEFLPIMTNHVMRKSFKAFYDAIDGGVSYREASFASSKIASPDASDEERWREVDTIQARFLSGEPVELKTAPGRTFLMTIRPMSHSRYVAVSVDITDHIAREQELERSRLQAEAAYHAKSAFLANMSHEIRTPLNGILGMAQVLVQGRITAAQREQAGLILTSGKALKTILDDVLDLSKIEAGRMELAPADQNLHDVLRRLARLWQADAEQKGILLRLDIDETLPAQHRFDAVRMSQCISNLLSNAIKFTERGEITIHASGEHHPKGTAISIEIADSGIGMRRETVEKLFEPFSQAEESIARRFGGTGLGLAITRKLARLMGGDVAVAGNKPGAGSTFKLTFIAHPAQGHTGTGATVAQPKAQMPVLAPKSRRAKHVLLVDDNALNRRVGNLFLKPEGYRITEAENGLEALARLAEDRFDIVLLDIHMPVLDGLATLKRIRASDKPWRNVPVIALTADAMSGDRERYLAEGMDGYISKPIEQRDLLAEIARLLGTGRSTQVDAAGTAQQSVG